MLDPQSILNLLENPTSKILNDLSVYYQLDSTNRWLRDQAVNTSVHGQVILAEYQTAGRGRGNNEWLGAPAAGVYLSIGWHFDAVPATLSALSLATGVVLAEALADSGANGVRLKWPNDLIHDGAKLGGILIESRGQLAAQLRLLLALASTSTCHPAFPGA